MIEAKGRGADVSGLEFNSGYIKETLAKARAKGLFLEIRQGAAENIPYPDNYFDFVNICEVLEHVEDPQKLLSEVHRVLKPRGRAYLSVPNRFGFYDQHFHLTLIGWLPRRWANFLIGVLGRHKDYSGANGRQNILDMHYFAFSQISRLVKRSGFEMFDIRQLKINKRFGRLGIIILFPYLFLRSVCLDSFHFLLIKN